MCTPARARARGATGGEWKDRNPPSRVEAVSSREERSEALSFFHYSAPIAHHPLSIGMIPNAFTHALAPDMHRILLGPAVDVPRLIFHS